MADIFISYARDDLEHIRPIAAALQAHGWEVWWDIEELRIGQPFSEAIEKALGRVKVVLVIWSNASVDSKWVQAEAAWAWDHDKYASVILDGLKPPFPFQNIHTENLSGWSGNASAPAFQKLIADLKAIVGVTPEDAEHIALERNHGIPEERRATTAGRFMSTSIEKTEQEPPKPLPWWVWALIYAVLITFAVFAALEWPGVLGLLVVVFVVSFLAFSFLKPQYFYRRMLSASLGAFLVGGGSQLSLDAGLLSATSDEVQRNAWFQVLIDNSGYLTWSAVALIVVFGILDLIIQAGNPSALSRRFSTFFAKKTFHLSVGPIADTFKVVYSAGRLRGIGEIILENNGAAAERVFGAAFVVVGLRPQRVTADFSVLEDAERSVYVPVSSSQPLAIEPGGTRMCLIRWESKAPYLWKIRRALKPLVFGLFCSDRFRGGVSVTGSSGAEGWPIETISQVEFEGDGEG